MKKEIPNKLFFKIGEVCEITDTQPYVLRYWESEFPALAPAKNSSGQRIYRRRDIETVLRIKELLYQEGFTIAGAKKRLETEMGGRLETPSGERSAESGGAGSAVGNTPAPASIRDEKTIGVMREVREQLRDILTLFDKNDRSRS
jgi:DNA-binding transcriptional MerR regulator